MLTNTDWIARDAEFPPAESECRLKQYKSDAELFNGESLKAYGSDFGTWANNLHMKDLNICTAIQYPQLMTKKTADFVCGEPIEIDVGTDSDKLLRGLEYLGFNSLLYEAVMDISRFGNAVIKMLDDRITIVPPRFWYPIVDEYDKKHVIKHVIAFKTDKTIYVEIHDKGYYERRIYEAVNNAGKHQFGMLLEEETIQTNIDDFAVQVLSNVTHSETLFGISDYDAIRDIHEELIWRIYCMKRILDKHSAPSMIGNSTMLTKDPITGREYINTGNFLVRDSDTIPKPEYLTWDGNLQAVEWQIEWLTNQMYTLSEMGAAFLEGAGKGEVNSGRALKLRMTSPLIKAQRIAGKNEATVKRIIHISALTQGINIGIEDIAITWNDGLPNDERDMAEIYNIATGGKPFMSQTTATKRFLDLSDDLTEQELENITVEGV